MKHYGWSLTDGKGPAPPCVVKDKRRNGGICRDIYPNAPAELGRQEETLGVNGGGADGPTAMQVHYRGKVTSQGPPCKQGQSPAWQGTFLS